MFFSLSQPIGTTVMETHVLKEPRGFMRVLQWFFAICAFATCANFSTFLQYDIMCGDAKESVRHNVSYPFR